MHRVFLRIAILLLTAGTFSNTFAQVKKVEGVGIVVRDMNRSIRFYSDVLQFRKVSDQEFAGPYWEQLYGVFGIRIRKVQMALGNEMIELIDYLTTGGRSIPEDARSNDLFFQHIAIVVSNIDSAYMILRKFDVPHVSTGPQTLPATIPAAAGIKAFYFQDPDHHTLEILYFPKGKGADQWQRANGTLFLGIDHTAIGIGQTDSSHEFYAGLLGVERKGDSWNKGTEQEHLNNVAGASLHITGYRAAAGPGIEFLEYIQPGPGKKYPVDTQSNDLWSWYTILTVKEIEKLYDRLKTDPRFQLVSKGLVHARNTDNTVFHSFIVRDPDGHALLITDKSEIQSTYR